MSFLHDDGVIKINRNTINSFSKSKQLNLEKSCYYKPFMYFFKDEPFKNGDIVFTLNNLEKQNIKPITNILNNFCIETLDVNKILTDKEKQLAFMNDIVLIGIYYNERTVIKDTNFKYENLKIDPGNLIFAVPPLFKENKEYKLELTDLNGILKIRSFFDDSIEFFFNIVCYYVFFILLYVINNRQAIENDNAKINEIIVNYYNTENTILRTQTAGIKLISELYDLSQYIVKFKNSNDERNRARFGAASYIDRRVGRVVVLGAGLDGIVYENYLDADRFQQISNQLLDPIHSKFLLKQNRIIELYTIFDNKAVTDLTRDEYNYFASTYFVNNINRILQRYNNNVSYVIINNDIKDALLTPLNNIITDIQEKLDTILDEFVVLNKNFISNTYIKINNQFNENFIDGFFLLFNDFFNGNSNDFVNLHLRNIKIYINQTRIQPEYKYLELSKKYNLIFFNKVLNEISIYFNKLIGKSNSSKDSINLNMIAKINFKKRFLGNKLVSYLN